MTKACLAGVVCVVGVLSVVLPAQEFNTKGNPHSQPFRFGRLFPSLPLYTAPPDDALATLTAIGTTAEPGPLFDTNLDADDNPNQVPSFFTYFGQFVDHDTTLDLLPLPDVLVNPTTLTNHRNPRLDLDSVLGAVDSQEAKILYTSDGMHLRTNDRDLPRNDDGSAVLIERRNDENQVIAQVHVVFLRAYNYFLDQALAGLKDNYGQRKKAPGLARTALVNRYQWIVVHEFLPELLNREVYADVFRPDGTIRTRYYLPNQAVMPVEFSVAAYRFGHSIVRRAYVIVEGGGKLQVFNGTANDLHGGRPIEASHTIFWPNFLNIDGITPTTNPLNQTPTNVSRKIDSLISSGLFTLPIPGAAPEGSSVLAFRNLKRARSYGVPSGQSVAAHLGIPVLTNERIASAIPRLGVLRNPAYRGETPLWVYLLAESQILEGGQRLGPVGSRIVAEVLGGLLLADSASYIRQGWTPPTGQYRAQDLLRDAGVLPPVLAAVPPCHRFEVRRFPPCP